MKRLKNTIIWILLLAKRYLKKPMFLIIVFAIPILSMVLKNTSGNGESALQVALYVENEGNNPAAEKVVNELCDFETNAIKYYRVDSEEKLEKAVQRGDAICGYVLPSGFEEQLKQFALGKTKSIIKCMVVTDGSFVKLANEVMFSSVYKEYAKIVLEQYMDNAKLGYDFGIEDKDGIMKLRQERYKNLQLKLFEVYYADGSRNKTIENASSGYLLLPLRGMILALILLASMAGGVLAFKDKEVGVFDVIRYKRQKKIQYIYVLIPTVVSSFMGLAGLILSGTAENIYMEIYNMILYCILVTGMTSILLDILNDLNRFVAIIPIFVIVNLILCPVFVNASGVIVAANYIKWALPLNYGLRGLHSHVARTIMIVAGVATIFVQNIDTEALIHRIKRKIMKR